MEEIDTSKTEKIIKQNLSSVRKEFDELKAKHFILLQRVSRTNYEPDKSTLASIKLLLDEIVDLIKSQNDYISTLKSGKLDVHKDALAVIQLYNQSLKNLLLNWQVQLKELKYSAPVHEFEEKTVASLKLLIKDCKKAIRSID